VSEQHRIEKSGALLDAQGSVIEAGWMPQPLLDCNLEKARFYRLRFMQKLRIKRWDYYALFTPTHFFSFTISDIGYMGMIFAYAIDFSTKRYHEETVMTPFGSGVTLPRNSTEGDSLFDNGKVRLHFQNQPGKRLLSALWKGFDGGELAAEAILAAPPEHESMTIVIPIGKNRFYYNRKINCLPAEGWVEYQGRRHTLSPDTCLASLDWGRGVWEYESFWVWASASGFLPDRRALGLNLGFGFGDTSAASENAVILNGHVHKLEQVDFHYDSKNFMAPWTMK